MIQKRALIELIKHRLEGEAQTKNLGKLHPKIIEYNIGRAYNTLVVQTFVRGGVTDAYIKEYTDVSIVLDTDTNVYYSTLPSPIVNLPRRAGNGVIRISATGDNDMTYVPVTNNQLKSMYGLMVNDVTDDVISYVVKNGRVEYYALTADLAATNVNMELMVTFDGYEDTDYVNLPYGADTMLMEMVVNFMLGTPDADNLNNNNTFNISKQR